MVGTLVGAGAIIGRPRVDRGDFASRVPAPMTRAAGGETSAEADDTPDVVVRSRDDGELPSSSPQPGLSALPRGAFVDLGGLAACAPYEGEDKAACAHSVLVGGGTPDPCYGLAGGAHWDCEVRTAALRGAATPAERARCQSMPSERADACYARLARATKDPELCDAVESVSAKEQCQQLAQKTRPGLGADGKFHPIPLGQNRR